MKAKTTTPSRKLGDDRNEPANKQRKRDQNFSQSRDVHENRGTVQSRLAGRTSTPSGKTKKR